MLQKQITDAFVGHMYKVSYTFTGSNCGENNGTLTTAINTILSGLVDPLGNDLQDTYLGSNTVIGCAPRLMVAGEVRYSNSQDAVKDDSTDSEVHAWVTKTAYTSGLTNITGFVIDFVSDGCSDTSLSYTNATTSLQLGTGTAVDISGLSENDAVVLEGSTSANKIIIRRTAAALPGTDQSDTLVFTSDTDYGFGLISKDGSTGNYVGYYNTDTTSSLDLLFPVVVHSTMLTPEEQLLSNRVGYLDTVGAGADEDYVVEELTVTATNTINDLSNSPKSATKVSLQVNGVDLIYGATEDFDLSGVAVTVYPTNIGYNIETTDTVVAKYFI